MTRQVPSCDVFPLLLPHPSSGERRVTHPALHPVGSKVLLRLESVPTPPSQPSPARCKSPAIDGLLIDSIPVPHAHDGWHTKSSPDPQWLAWLSHQVPRAALPHTLQRVLASLGVVTTDDKSGIDRRGGPGSSPPTSPAVSADPGCPPPPYEKGTAEHSGGQRIHQHAQPLVPLPLQALLSRCKAKFPSEGERPWYGRLRVIPPRAVSMRRDDARNGKPPSWWAGSFRGRHFAPPRVGAETGVKR